MQKKLSLSLLCLLLMAGVASAQGFEPGDTVDIIQWQRPFDDLKLFYEMEIMEITLTYVVVRSRESANSVRCLIPIDTIFEMSDHVSIVKQVRPY